MKENVKSNACSMNHSGSKTLKHRMQNLTRLFSWVAKMKVFPCSYNTIRQGPGCMVYQEMQPGFLGRATQDIPHGVTHGYCSKCLEESRRRQGTWVSDSELHRVDFLPTGYMTNHKYAYVHKCNSTAIQTRFRPLSTANSEYCPSMFLWVMGHICVDFA
jgi:hypothetical protein